MAIPVKRKVKVLAAKYSEEAKSICLIGECEEGRFRPHIHRDAFFPQGIKSNVPEKEITKMFNKFVDSLYGKEIDVVFDPDLTERLNANDPLKY